MDTIKLLEERFKTHGDFFHQAQITQMLKDAYMRFSTTYTDLNSMEKEALAMIFSKIGRIGAGNPHFKDHWDDIAGYAKLVADSCPDAPKSPSQS